ncbi:MAG: GTPase ObgE [Bacillota bacterium]|jgi:GTP-binding protein
MFYDYAKIYIQGGAGGNGIAAFRREKYVPMGGPAGGDGGRGGNIILIGDRNLKTLADFRYKRHYRADRGQNGSNKNQHGQGAPNLYLRVPLGTICRDHDTNELLADIVVDGQEFVVAKGGRGGRGNSRFATAQNKAPRMAEKGAPGEERNIQLELKLLADVGLIGLPNVGKSTLISRVSAAKPKIANYPFTTLQPNLGVVDLDDGKGFVMADLPGLVEGAAEGVGLGQRFLRHTERTRVLIHVLDMSGLTESDIYDDFCLLLEELRRYREDLMERPQIIAANKMDLPQAAENLSKFKAKLQENGQKYEIFPISAIKGQGLKSLVQRAAELIAAAPEPMAVKEEEIKHTIVKDEQPWQIAEIEPGFWQVTGQGVEKLVAMTDMQNDEAVSRMQKIFAKIGFDKALKEAGIQEGDVVKIGREEFDFAE